MLRLIIVSLLIGAALVLLIVGKIYYIRDDSGGVVLSQGNEAWLFINVSHRGRHLSYVEYPWEMLTNYVRAPSLADDTRTVVTVVHITSSGIARHEVRIEGKFPASAPIFYTPFGGHIYANCQGKLCRWSDSGFQVASQEEQETFDGIVRLTPDIDTRVDGWSKRGMGAGPENVFVRSSIGLANMKLVEKSEAIDSSGYAAVSIQLEKPNQRSERVWYLDGRPRRVTGVEYERIFARQ